MPQKKSSDSALKPKESSSVNEEKTDQQPTVTPIESSSKPRKPKVLLIVLLVIILLALFGGGIWWYLSSRAKKPQNQSQTQATQQTPAKTDPMANWHSYTEVYEGATFKYPPDWQLQKLDTTQQFQNYNPDWKGPYETIKLTAPSGFVLSLDSHIQGLGGGCDPADCPQNTIVAMDQVSKLKNGNPLYLMKVEVRDSAGQKLQSRTIGLYAPITDQQIYKAGTYQGFPPFVLFPSQGVDGVLAEFAGPRGIGTGELSNTGFQPNLTAEQYFNQPDLQTAAQILSSVSF